MSPTYAADRRGVRPLAPDVQRKVDKILAGAPRRERIKRIRAGLQYLIDCGEREWQQRRRACEGNDPPGLLLKAIEIETAFELLLKDLHQ